MLNYSGLVSYSGLAQKASAISKERDLESFAKDARASLIKSCSHYPPPPLLKEERINSLMKRLRLPNNLFVDSTYPFSDRLDNLRCFWSLNAELAYYVILDGLSSIFNLLYTRNKSDIKHANAATYCCMLTWPLTLALAIPAIGLLHRGHKQAYSHEDVIVTFVMVYGTLLLHIVSAFIILKSAIDLHDTVPQQSLIGSFARKRRHKGLIAITNWLQCKGLLDQYWCMKPYDKPMDVTRLVYMYVRDGWTKYIQDAESYRRFNDNMGQWALERAQCGELLGWSLERPFDEIVLLWHVATDFCFIMPDKSYLPTEFHSPLPSPREMGRAISNYMMHLLFANPEMLMAGTRRNLFETAYKELLVILKDEKDLPLNDEEKLMPMIIDKVKFKQD